MDCRKYLRLQNYREKTLLPGGVLNPPLVKAALGGNNNSVENLLKNGDDPNMRSADGWPPLMCAVQSNYGDCARSLLAAKAEVDACLPGGDTSMNYAARQGHPEMIKLLHEHKADVNNRSMLGDTPLMDAAESGRKVCCEHLIRFKADLNAKNCVGRTALAEAQRMGHIDLVGLMQ